MQTYFLLCILFFCVYILNVVQCAKLVFVQNVQYFVTQGRWRENDAMFGDGVITNGLVLIFTDELVGVTVVFQGTYFVIDVVASGGQLSSKRHGAHLTKHNEMTVRGECSSMVGMFSFVLSCSCSPLLD